LEINEKCKIPIIYDSFHHECLNNGERFKDAVRLASDTWKEKDGILMADYSQQKQGERKGVHTYHINPKAFEGYLRETQGYDFDVMLEIKDKEASAKTALAVFERCL
jgi:UV DNA damage endonuclease